MRFVFFFTDNASGANAEHDADDLTVNNVLGIVPMIPKGSIPATARNRRHFVESTGGHTENTANLKA